MSINVNKITSTLAKLGDTELQQYAQMHKNDPYIMALAMSESNRRKEMRESSQAPQGQEQPKVVDKMLAEMGGRQEASPEQMARLSQMLEARKQAEYEEFTGGRQAQPAPQQLPEEMGIGQLPAGDMNFAGGGIVAFADGGDVERYSGEFGSLVEPIDPLTGTFYMPGHFDSPADPASMRRVQASPYVPAQVSAEEAAFLKKYPKPGAVPKTETKADTSRTRTPPAPAAAPTTPAADKKPTGLDALIQDVTRKTDLAQGDLRNQRVGLAAQYVQSAEQEREEGEKRRKARGDVFAGREARLAEREKGLAGMKDQNFGLALLQAGAAMMTTPGNIGTAIGKGVQVGSERYVAGIDKINAAKEKFAEARDRLDDLRINRDDMNEKEIIAENRAIRNARLQGQQLFLDGATNDLKMTTDNMRTFFTAAAEDLQTDKRIKSAENIAGMQERGANARAAMPTGADRTAMMLGTGDTPAARLESGMIRLQQITADKSGMAAVKVLADINAKRVPGEPAVTMDDLLKGAREFSSLMYGPKVADVAPNRARP